MLFDAVVLAFNAKAPTPTLLFPEVKAAKELLPIAIASPPVYAPNKASRPIAIELVPVVIPDPTLSPIAIFPEPPNEPLLRVLLPKATLSVPVGKLPSSLIVPPSTETSPATVRPSVTAVPVTSIPELVVDSFAEP